MSSHRLLIITLIISVILHLFIIIFIKFVPYQENKQTKSNEPIEIEVLPKNPAAPEIIPEYPVTDNEDTTLDHDKNGGNRSGKKPEREETLPENRNTRPSHDNNIETPEISEPEQSRNNTNNIPNQNNINLFDKEVIDRIANTKPAKKQGEDTASYNEFEEKYASYFAKFRRRVYQLWQYPKESIAMGESGVVKLSFSILRDGSIVNIKMLESSGYSALDREVMRVLKNMGKIPLPESYELNQLNVEEAYFIYSLGSGFGRFLQ